MKTLVVALGGNALLQRGEALTAKINIAILPVLCLRWRAWPVLIVWRLFTATGRRWGCWRYRIWRGKKVEPYPLDVLVAESQG